VREEEPGNDTDRRSHDAREQRLCQHHAEYLAARCPERSQQRQFARALRDEDAEGVDDDIRADEQRYEREDQEDGAQDPEERIDALDLLTDSVAPVAAAAGE